jgi:hypothetical protein
MTVVAERVVVTEPGVFDGMPDDLYHADPVPGGSLSNSGAKLLLAPHCPAKYRWYTDNGRPDKPEFELGRAAHREVLGVGADIVLVDRERWDTKAVKEELADIRDAGMTPIKRKDWDRIQGMAAALRAHPLAGPLLDPATGPVEQSLFWVDPATGVMRRCRIDKLGYVGGRTVVVDYKSAVSAHPDACSKAMDNYGYNRQGPWYEDGAIALGLGDDGTSFHLIFQEKEPPYLVTVAWPDPIAQRAGRALNRQALDVFARCQSTGDWPGYADTVIELPLPSWTERRFLDEEIYS